jgi:spermidine/putrescine transport system substrate-binding protein
MKKMKLWGIITLALLLTFSLTACGKKPKAEVNVYNWGDYIDEQVLKDFEKETGIRVNYDTFTTNEDMYIKIKSGGSSYDVAIPSDYMIEKMIKEDLLNKINMANVPNFKNIDPMFKNLGYDKNNEYSVSYMWGTVGILYNKTMVKEPVDSWNILWDSKYKQQILMLDSQRDSIAVALKKLGYSLNSTDKKELEAAKQELIKQKPLVLAYVGDDVKDKMIAGEAALAIVYSGDAMYMMKENPDLAYALPKEGSNLWYDGMVIPKTAKNQKEAEQFINYMSSPEVALKNTNYIGFSTTNMETKKLLPEDIKNSPVAYPNINSLKNCEVFVDLGPQLAAYDRVWTEIKSAQ